MGDVTRSTSVAITCFGGALSEITHESLRSEHLMNNPGDQVVVATACLNQRKAPTSTSLFS